jgi:adenylyltransferase/sulfurtransferase
VVVGALDNREARIFVNKACAQLGKTWIDGGIEVLNGIVRAFAPPATACYECTMGQADWDQVAARRSCSLLARHAHSQGGAPTTPTTASIIGAVQAQEVVKHLHGMQTLLGAGYVFEGLAHNSFTVKYRISADCPWHEPAPPLETSIFNSQTPLREIAAMCKERLGGCDAIDLSREIVAELHCVNCDIRRRIMVPLDSISQAQALCAKCRGECSPVFFHSIGPDSPLLNASAAQLGLPRWDVLWPRYGTNILGVELGGDAADA